MKSSFVRRIRRVRNASSSEGAFFKKESTLFDAPGPAPFFSAAGGVVQRKCDQCEEQDKPLKRKEAAPAGAAVATPLVSGVLSGSSQALPPALGHYFSRRMGQDIRHAKIHTGSEAAQAAKSIHAKAYTVGGHIVFGEGQYQPETHEGKKLIAHELAHVVQQSGATAPLLHRAPDNKEELKKTYSINIKKGDKDWKPEELIILKNALARLKDDEPAVMRNYQFIRWSTKAARARMDTSYKDPGTSECALHEMDLATASYKISVYDACFSDPEARPGTDTTFGIDTGEFHILHEIGHAMEVAELRKTYEAALAADKAYNDYIAQHKDSDATAAMQAEADRLSKAAEAAKQAMTDATGRGIKEFTEMMKGKEAITEYGKESNAESFAELFAAFKANPDLVKKDYPAIYAWLLGRGYLKHIVKKK